MERKVIMREGKEIIRIRNRKRKMGKWTKKEKV